MDDLSFSLWFCCQSSALAAETSVVDFSAITDAAVSVNLFGAPMSMEDELAISLRFSTMPRQRYFESAFASSQSTTAPTTSASVS